MGFSEVGRGTTGFSTPILGVSSWDPGTAGVSVTRRAWMHPEESIGLKGGVGGIVQARDEGPDDEPTIGSRRRWR